MVLAPGKREAQDAVARLLREVQAPRPPRAWCFTNTNLQDEDLLGIGHREGLRWNCPECEKPCGLHDHADERGREARDELDLKVIGVDEKSVGHGPRFFTMVYDHVGRRVVHRADGRGKESR